MRVLVTGGAGYIGSVVVEELIKDGHKIVVYDNLSKGHRDAVSPAAQFVHADLADIETLRDALTHNKIEAVIHMAADALVGESVEFPEKYYQNNVVNGLNLLDEMKRSGVNRIVFSSTAATYGQPDKQPIEETAPTNPTNPYGETKLEFERALQNRSNEGLRYVALRYFNAAGATAQFGEDHRYETHLIPIALQVASGKRDVIEVYGDDYPTADGTCVRDYIHVVDLARAHILALDAVKKGSAIYNLGCGGEGYSVNDVIQTAREVTQRDIHARVGPRRPGDPAVLIASSDKIKRELNWKPQFQDLRLIVESAWRWMLQHPDGYAR